MERMSSGGRDPGLQPERTRLAWRRTTLSATVTAVLAVRTVLHEGANATGAAAAVGCGVVWLGLLLVAHRRLRALDADRPAALTGRQAAAAVLCTVLLAGCAVAVVF
jgi:uncharacterized membrane protein YidH (DUF202 family)